MSIYCELIINNPVDFTSDELTRVGKLKSGTFLDQVKDGQIYLYRKSLENISIYSWDNVVSCHSVKCDRNLHNLQLENLYNTLIGTILASCNYFIKRKRCPKNQIIGWNMYCKDLHSNVRHNFFLWHNNGLLRSGGNFKAMKASQTRFKRSLKFC